MKKLIDGGRHYAAALVCILFFVQPMLSMYKERDALDLQAGIKPHVDLLKPVGKFPLWIVGKLVDSDGL